MVRTSREIHSVDAYVEAVVGGDVSSSVEFVANEETWLEILKLHPELSHSVAINKVLPDTVLEVLSEDKNPAVRSITAMKRSVPISVARKLARDENDGVRAAIARNKKVPLDVLAGLSGDPSWVVKEALEANLRARTG